MFRTEKLNIKDVTPVPDLVGKGDDKRKVKGGDIIPLYSNVFLCAKKKSGKTSVIYKIIKETCTKDTKVILFVSTLYKDQNYINIRKYLDLKKIEYEAYTSIKEGGVDKLNEIVTELQEQAKRDEDAKEEHDGGKMKNDSVILADASDDDDDDEPKKSKYRSPEYLFIFDDLSSELKAKSLTALIKKNRHFLCNVVISSQYLHDVDLQARKNIDVFIIFKGQSDEKLNIIYRDADLAIPYEQFKEIYTYATKDKYSFLYIDTRSDSFRKSFNIAIKLKSNA